MTTPLLLFFFFFFFFILTTTTTNTDALGSTSSINTLAILYGNNTTTIICSLTTPLLRIQCYSTSNNTLLPQILPSVSFSSISAGFNTLCAIRSPGFTLLCWNTTLLPKRLYFNTSSSLNSLSIGSTQICALANGTNQENVICWREEQDDIVPVQRFRMVSTGVGVSCGVLEVSNRIVCWGENQELSNLLQNEFSSFFMLEIVVGGRHACGISINSGLLICRGENESGQLNVPSNLAFEYRPVLALGENHTCAIRRLNRTVVCWGGNGYFNSNTSFNVVTNGVSFETIVAGLDFTCGVTTSNFSVVCWGAGWNGGGLLGNQVPFLSRTLPGQCVQTVCECNVYPESETLCGGNGHICRGCDFPDALPPNLPPSRMPPPSPPLVDRRLPSRPLRRGLLAFAIVGAVGGVAGICTVVYCLWTGVCLGKKKIYNSVQPTINGGGNQSRSSSGPPSRSSTLRRQCTLRRQGSIIMRRQRSGTSSKHTERAEELLFSDLVAATNNFSLENKLGAGSFGVVYKGKLPDGREVAIKRSETGPRAKKFQEKESAFDSEIAFLSRLHHKHLVGLVGYCEEMDERLLVYEYMKNGALYDHLHDKNNVEKSSNFVNSWKVRIKVSLDAARGIEYLHNYAVPPIIHRDIKSSNILLDSTWTARVSDFGLSLLGPENDRDYRPMKPAGTVGYIDPEYYGLNMLTAKSDVYGLGVVLLELLTGKRAIFKSGEGDCAPISLVDYAVPIIMTGELGRILDPRVGPPETNESEAVELVAYTAIHCVHLEGKDRPTMSDIVANLERALALCDESHGSISSGRISIVSE